MIISLSIQADKIDYTYCQELFQGPVKIDDEGNITPHAGAKYKLDKKGKTEILTFKQMALGSGHTIKITVKRDNRGRLSQVQFDSKFNPSQTKSGLGSQNLFGGSGGLGMGMPFGGGLPMETSMVTDIKIKGGKCFPYRTISKSKTGNYTHTTFHNEVQLCRELRQFVKDAQKKEDSKLGKLKKCYDSYQKEAQKVIRNHLKRNSDLYQPKENKFMTGGFGFAPQTGAGLGTRYLGVPGPGGGFIMSLDSIVQSPQLSPAQKIEVLSAYCRPFSHSLRSMLRDDDLFVKGTKAGESVTPGESTAIQK